MKIKWLVVCVLLLAGCREKKAPLAEAVFPVYKVDLDKVDSVNMRDLFSAVELIPLQKKAGYTITSPQLGLYKGNYYLWDDTEKRMFCFGSSGNFKYVTKEDGLKSINRNSASHRSRRVSIMDQLGYRYQKNGICIRPFGRKCITWIRAERKRRLTAGISESITTRIRWSGLRRNPWMNWWRTSSNGYMKTLLLP